MIGVKHIMAYCPAMGKICRKERNMAPVFEGRVQIF
jgi:hypothetical protein